MVVMPALTEGQEPDDVSVSWRDVFLEGFWSPNVRHAVDGPSDVKRQNVAENIDVVSAHECFTEEISWYEDWKPETAQKHKRNVIPKKLCKF